MRLNTFHNFKFNSYSICRYQIITSFLCVSEKVHTSATILAVESSSQNLENYIAMMDTSNLFRNPSYWHWFGLYLQKMITEKMFFIMGHIYTIFSTVLTFLFIYF